MLEKVLAIAALIAFALLSAITQSTTPSTIHPFGILLVFILLYVLALGVLTFLLYGLVHLVQQFIRPRVQKHSFKKHSFTFKRAYVYGLVLALTPIMMVGMASIGRLGIYEVLLICTFEAVICFYVNRYR